MFGFGGLGEIAFILFVAMLIFGPEKLPEIGRLLAKGMAEVRKASNELKRTLNAELAVSEQEAETRRLAALAPPPSSMSQPVQATQAAPTGPETPPAPATFAPAGASGWPALAAGPAALSTEPPLFPPLPDHGGLPETAETPALPEAEGPAEVIELAPEVWAQVTGQGAPRAGAEAVFAGGTKFFGASEPPARAEGAEGQEPPAERAAAGGQGSAAKEEAAERQEAPAAPGAAAASEPAAAPVLRAASRTVAATPPGGSQAPSVPIAPPLLDPPTPSDALNGQGTETARAAQEEPPGGSPPGPDLEPLAPYGQGRGPLGDRADADVN